MKKILISILLVLCCYGFAFGFSFKDILKQAKQGDVTAQFNLGDMYENSNLLSMFEDVKGVPQDYKKAAYWYTKAAKQGDISSQSNLGFMYDNGKGVPQDYKKAYVLFSLAAAQGNKEAIINKNVSAKFLTPSQLSEAQNLAANLNNELRHQKPSVREQQ